MGEVALLHCLVKFTQHLLFFLLWLYSFFFNQGKSG